MTETENVLPFIDFDAELDSFAKKSIALRYWLQALEYHGALRALNLVGIYERDAFRKDGVTPNMSHFVEIALFLSRLPNIRDRETLIVVGLLHDLVEDHGFPLETVRLIFGEQVATSVFNMTKKFPVMHGGTPIDIGYLKPGHGSIIVHKGGDVLRHVERDEDELYEAMSYDEFASLAKPTDRGHNQKTMAGVFGPAKQLGYVDFTDARILPMAKQARQRFVHHEPAYVMVETLLRTQARIVRGWAAEASKAA
jgi:(p)ppGpp synthase/HD superfamily hydrolase